MKKIVVALVILVMSSACTHGGADKPLSFIHIIDSQAVEFHSAIDVVIVTTMAFVSFIQLFFG